MNHKRKEFLLFIKLEIMATMFFGCHLAIWNKKENQYKIFVIIDTGMWTVSLNWKSKNAAKYSKHLKKEREYITDET